MSTAWVAALSSGRRSAGIRRQVWEAASRVGAEGDYDNTALIWEILELRQEKAALLGHSLGGKVAMAGDGQVTLDRAVVKQGARKVRRVGEGNTLAGFAGAAADAVAGARGDPVPGVRAR